MGIREIKWVIPSWSWYIGYHVHLHVSLSWKPRKHCPLFFSFLMSFRRRKNAPFHSRLIRPPLAHNAVKYKIFAALSQRLYIYI